MIYFLVAIDLFGSLLGIQILNAERFRHWTISLRSGILAALALSWMLPEMSHTAGPLGAPFILLSAVALLFAVDRYVYPVCPCRVHLHGKGASSALIASAWPLMVAVCIQMCSMMERRRCFENRGSSGRRAACRYPDP